tara:strand:+ start:1004 stop:1684 length:681 start_codon:yes stop_codon:yes gene_type:complete
MEDFAENKSIIQNFYIKYTTLINEYLNYAYDNLDKNSSYKDIISKGIQLITHIFKFNMLKTQNINLTIDICHKNYLYYIEFISQITENDNHLSLTPNDAVFFVLKKSVFNIINNETDGYEIENFDKLCPVINELITFHNTILYYYIDLIDMDSHTHFFVFNENIYLITEHILKIHSMNNVKNLISYAMISKIKNLPFDQLTKNLIQFMTYISDTHINNDDIYNIIV